MLVGDDRPGLEVPLGVAAEWEVGSEVVPQVMRKVEGGGDPRVSHVTTDGWCWKIGMDLQRRSDERDVR